MKRKKICIAAAILLAFMAIVPAWSHAQTIAVPDEKGASCGVCGGVRHFLVILAVHAAIAATAWIYGVFSATEALGKTVMLRSMPMSALIPATTSASTCRTCST